jgi:hypothetical protein
MKVQREQAGSVLWLYRHSKGGIEEKTSPVLGIDPLVTANHDYGRTSGSHASTEAPPLPSRTGHIGSKTFFFHILKTGGVTFRSLLTSLYGNSFQICYDPTIASIESSRKTARCLEFHTLQFEGRLTHMHAEIDRLDRWDVLEGHHSFTMLREPVDQAVSLFYHMQRKRPRVEKLYRRMGVEFPETLEQYLDGPHHFNTQAAFLANKHQLTAEHALTRADLDKAKDTLVRRQIHVGLTERFADSMNIFESVTGLKIPGDVVPIQNQNHDRLPLSEIPQRLKDRIREQSALDVELYAFARELFLGEFSRSTTTRRYTFVPAAPRVVPTPALEAQTC